MKTIDLLCTSPASTATCLSIDEHNPIIKLGGRAIDRYNPHLRDYSRRLKPIIPSTCIPRAPPPPPPPPNSKSNHHNAKKKKKTSSNSSNTTGKQIQRKNNVSPPGSSRCLLSDTDNLFEGVSDFNPRKAIFSCEQPPRWSDNYIHDSKELIPSSSSRKALISVERPPRWSDNYIHTSRDIVPSSSRMTLISAEPTPRWSDNYKHNSKEMVPSDSSSSSRPSSQVVVLRVSLHCKACEGKVRKHISRMQGVTSFTIDFPTKKVTVIGDVTPLDVLNSVSKVKNAQLWPSWDSLQMPPSVRSY